MLGTTFSAGILNVLLRRSGATNPRMSQKIVDISKISEVRIADHPNARNLAEVPLERMTRKSS